MNEPLKWCLDWKHLTRREKFMRGVPFPFTATEDRAYNDIVRQLKGRQTSDLGEWSRFPQDVQEMARMICQRLKSDRIWPSDVFFPDDPADIPLAVNFPSFTDKWDFLPYSFDLVEKQLGIKMPIDFWGHVDEITFAEAITLICKQKAEKGMMG